MFSSAAVPNGNRGELIGVGTERLQDEDVRRTVFEALVREHQDQIFRYCTARLGAVYGEDVAQDVFLAAWEGLPRFRHEAEITTWLMGIAKHKCAQVLRNYGRRGEIARMFVEEIRSNVHPDLHAAQAEAAKVQEQLGRLVQSLHRLSAEERIVINLRYTKGLAVDEIAELIGKTEAAVRKQVVRTLQRLRRTMADVTEKC
jgi:RNA polymerase sigma-70 factor (ECF subfamily)